MVRMNRKSFFSRLSGDSTAAVAGFALPCGVKRDVRLAGTRATERLMTEPAGAYEQLDR